MNILDCYHCYYWTVYSCVCCILYTSNQFVRYLRGETCHGTSTQWRSFNDRSRRDQSECKYASGDTCGVSTDRRERSLYDSLLFSNITQRTFSFWVAGLMPLGFSIIQEWCLVIQAHGSSVGAGTYWSVLESQGQIGNVESKTCGDCVFLWAVFVFFSIISLSTFKLVFKFLYYRFKTIN